MYKIIGADGNEYGPVSVEQLHQWLGEGRVNKQTRVLAEGSTDWTTLGEVPELAVATPFATTPTPLTMAPSQSSALQMIQGPAIFILVLAILNILACALGFVWSSMQDQLLALSKVPEQSAELQRKIAMYFSLPANIVGGVFAVICLVGAIRMMKLKSYGLAMTTAIIMLIPCSSCCCLLNIGAGIWALVILSKPEVKSAFQ